MIDPATVIDPRDPDVVDWTYLKWLRRSQVPAALAKIAKRRGSTPAKLRRRFIRIYGREAELLPDPGGR